MKILNARRKNVLLIIETKTFLYFFIVLKRCQNIKHLVYYVNEKRTPREPHRNIPAEFPRFPRNYEGILQARKIKQAPSSTWQFRGKLWLGIPLKQCCGVTSLLHLRPPWWENRFSRSNPNRGRQRADRTLTA